MALAAYFANWPRAPGTSYITCSSTAVISRSVLGVTDRSQLNAAFGKASRGVPKAVRDAAQYDISTIKIQGEPVWNFLQFTGQKVNSHDMADLLRCIDAVAGDGASFDSLRRFVHTPTTGGGVDDDDAAAIDVAGAVFRQLCVLSSAARALLSNDLSESCARLEADGTCPPMTRTSTKLLRDALKKVVDAGAAFLPPVEPRRGARRTASAHGR